MPLKTRRHHSPEEKVRLLRLHLLIGRAVSEICDSEGIHRWLRVRLAQGVRPVKRNHDVLQHSVARVTPFPIDQRVTRLPTEESLLPLP